RDGWHSARQRQARRDDRWPGDRVRVRHRTRSSRWAKPPPALRRPLPGGVRLAMVTIGGRSVSLGLWYDFRNPPQWAKPPAELYAHTFEHIRYAERLGFDSIWTSEHHFI